MNWQERVLERTQSSFKYKVCTDSIAKTAGTTKRSTWGKDAKRRYDRCLKKVTERSIYDLRPSNPQSAKVGSSLPSETIKRIEQAKAKSRSLPKKRK